MRLNKVDYVAGVFRSFIAFKYHLWATGALISNVGIWMHRAAQDRIVFNELSRDCL